MRRSTNSSPESSRSSSFDSEFYDKLHGSFIKYCQNFPLFSATMVKIVVGVSMNDEKSHSEAMKFTVGIPGIKSVALAGAEKDKLVVVGKCIDALELLKRLRKGVGYAELLSLENLRNESFSMKENLESGDVKIGLIDKKVSGSRKVRDDYYEKKRKGSCEDLGGYFPKMGSLPSAVEGEQVAAGWPSWLVAVAGEAILGWVPRKADTFEKLDKIGQGTYSSVYKGRDLLTNKYVALKKVCFDNMDPESVKFMAREILILRMLDHPNIIKLEGLVTSKTSTSLYLVFEYMEHDLTGLASLPGVKFSEPQVKCYMKQLLSGLDYCHRKGVLHRDINGSNLLINNHGILKIADFGLASFFDIHNKIPLTSRVVTLWYRPPELLLGATHYGVAVDLWSTGCILGELYAGKPIMPGRTEVEQLHKIFKLCGSPSEDYWKKSKLPHSTVLKPIQPYRRRIADTFKDIHDAFVKLMEILLSVDPSDRGTAASALESEFFKTSPIPCDPSSLPKYPPSKEIVAKQREEEARRKGAAEAKGHKGDNDSKKPREFRSVVGLDSNAELSRLMPDGHGKERKIHFSGPLLAPSNNIEQMLKEHDRRIQEAALRLRHEKTRAGRVRPHETQTSSKQTHVSNQSAG
ncbi:probable serine/threonine-protein kinase At1g54610 isoform X1 [Salvia splendens]|uniref:probable serine/threonine-protein kinase At1g54610 isoform X1 n=2 Tax=Salvia splendens TaxID=180675 RepID=UPI001C276C03|nr:probable serine/threonine-protein kinase At1g54610 isoform X1 [Salvia splendens]XP_042021702.1 probable serine/threonine-protein kinase At1g54610 isoform X1 [Salvia splendens]